MLLSAPKVASQLDVLPGAEFRVAFEEAMNYGGKVILGDRPVQVCLVLVDFVFSFRSVLDETN
jgi:pheromone shutdown protein TraB